MAPIKLKPLSSSRQRILIKAGLTLVLSGLMLFQGACTTLNRRAVPAADISPCHVIYDAGSSSTRLFIYQHTSSGWVKHSGPKTAALADPVRGIRGKTLADTPAVVDDIVTALDDIRNIGPPAKNGKPGWPGFDWKERCRVESVMVLGTAGMRLAEQIDRVATDALWSLLNQRLGSALERPVITRTLSGYEEGLFAWLAIREGLDNDNFGVAEMGGASLQITFPCARCEGSKMVRVKDRVVSVFSHSFLGWGQDEAWKKFGHSPACAHAAGLTNPDWQTSDCTAGAVEFEKVAAETESLVINTDGLRWYLSDAFRYMQDNDIDRFCRQGIDGGFEKDSSCFRAVYLHNVITALGLPADAEAVDADWTLGAVICTATQCLDTR